MLMDDLFTSESVSEGHPDKLADQISDSVLDAFLKEDSSSRVACEVFLSQGLVCVSGEVKSKSRPDVSALAREVIKNAGYDSQKKGLDFRSSAILSFLNDQSVDIQNAVGEGQDQGAGDQGIMFGYAVNETPQAMPLSIHLAHQLVKNLSLFRKQGHDFLWPDSKSQVTVRYEKGKVKDLASIVVSSQHAPDCKLGFLREFIRDKLIKETVPEKYLTKNTKILVNPGGRFVLGGPLADCGLTGRKIIVDTYGGHGAHGGGAFSGKDPSKVDRSASYVARHIAKNIVRAELAKKCLVQLSYAIGLAAPVSVRVEDFNTSPVSRNKLHEMVLHFWDLKPSGIIKELDLLKPRYQDTSTYGHFGREEPHFTWENTDKAALLKDWTGKTNSAFTDRETSETLQDSQ